jgi:hypothetical protein
MILNEPTKIVDKLSVNYDMSVVLNLALQQAAKKGIGIEIEIKRG